MTIIYKAKLLSILIISLSQLASLPQLGVDCRLLAAFGEVMQLFLRVIAVFCMSLPSIKQWYWLLSPLFEAVLFLQ